MQFRKLFVICSLAILSSCATRSTVCQHLDLGMTKQEVLKKAGKPFSKSCSKDIDGNIIEIWSYNETTWDDGGLTFDRTILKTNVLFDENGTVKSYENAGERAVADPTSTVFIY